MAGLQRLVSSLMPSKTVYKDILKNNLGLRTSLRLQYEQLSSTATETKDDIDDISSTPQSCPGWSPQSRRTGIIALKLGMSQLWDKNGQRIPVTLLQIVDNQVVMVRRKEKEGYNALQIGAVNHSKIKRIIKPILGQFYKSDVTPKRFLQEFRVTEDAILPVGTHLYASHFVPGQYVDVTSKTIGKGFQGVMKRHGMKGQPASHGVTKTHRKMGATGGGQDPGRIWPGKRMPGRMGGKTTNTLNLKIYRINHQFNVIYVNGCVPGHKNTPVRITDARRRPHKTTPPFPTYFPDYSIPFVEETYAEEIHKPNDMTIEFSV